MSVKFYHKLMEGIFEVKKYQIHYVKKIWSLNPTKYKFIQAPEALKKYDEYLTAFVKSPVSHSSNWKSFENWLETEI